MYGLQVKGFVDRGETDLAEELEIIEGAGVGRQNSVVITFDVSKHDSFESLTSGDVITLVLRVE